MKAVVVYGAGDVRVEEREAVEPGSDQVQIAVTHGGICGSDLHYYREGKVGAFEVHEPLVLGHEVVGTVVKDGREGYKGREGREGSALPVGTPVTVHPASYDTASPGYRADRPNISQSVPYLGSAATTPHTQGAFSELFTVAATQLRVLPASLPLTRGVLAEPLGVALHALGRAGNVRGLRVLVSGSGPIGLLAVRAAVTLEAAEVWATDVLEHPLTLARNLGAAGTIDLRSEHPERGSFDIVIEAAGVPAATATALSAVRSGGTIIQVGLLPGQAAPYPLAELVSREIELRGSFRFINEIDDAVRLLDADPEFERIITHSFLASDAQSALDTAADAARSSKVVLQF